jgi:hypothetical protein
VWNEKIFGSFQSGNLKALDLETYRQLHSPTARRIYRFLDKRFFQRAHWRFDLSHFSYNKIGLSRTAYKDVAQLKRQLKPAIEQLEAAQIIMPVPAKERFKKVARGVWEIHFEKFSKTRQETFEIDTPDESQLESKLVARGVGRTQARKLLAEYGDERVRERLEWLDYLEAKKTTGGIKSIPGYLVRSVTDPEFAKPEGFKSAKDKAEETAQKAAREREKAEARQRAEKEENARQEAAESELRAAGEFLATLPEKKQAKIREMVLADCPFDKPSIRQTLVNAKVAEMLKNGEFKNG